MKFPFKNRKKAVMGVGMLLIFISTILVSAVAAGVLIRTTGLMQESALQVATDAQNRLISGLDVFSVYAIGNTTNEQVYGLEFLVRLRSGSPPIQVDSMGLSYVSGQDSFTATLNESLIGNSCNYNNLTPETEWCFNNRLGDNDTVLEDGELYSIKYLLNGSSQIEPEQSFEVTFQPKRGATNYLQLETPDLVLDAKLRLR